jgi:hypothetical protein
MSKITGPGQPPRPQNLAIQIPTGILSQKFLLCKKVATSLVTNDIRLSAPFLAPLMLGQGIFLSLFLTGMPNSPIFGPWNFSGRLEVGPWSFCLPYPLIATNEKRNQSS